MSKPKRRIAAADAVIATLAARFPQCFTISEQGHRPLKVNIRLDVIAAIGATIAPQELGRALRWYTHNPVYLRSTIAGAPRIDLDGKLAGTVTVAEAAHAKELLAELKARAKQAAIAQPQPSVAPIAASGRTGLGLADLRAAGRRRREAA